MGLLINNTIKTLDMRQTKKISRFTTSSQETELVYSFNPESRTGLMKVGMLMQILLTITVT